jgi:inorganic pyrophosphatase
MLSEETTALFIGSSCIVGLLFGIFHIIKLTRVQVGEHSASGSQVYSQMHNDPKYLSDLIGRKLIKQIQRNPQTGKEEEVEIEGQEPYYTSWDEAVQQLKDIGAAVADGANAFLMEEYRILALFSILFAAVIEFLVEEKLGEFWTVAAFFLGAVTSIVSGYVGMKVAVYANSRTAYSAVNREHGLANAFKVAYRGGAVLGFVLSSLGLLNLFALINLYNRMYLGDDWTSDDIRHMYECIAGYGLGGSTIAMFGRVGGGIYTKAADVGADLAGKVEEGMEEDDPRNPATIADNVGDNVGDIAGMGADLFGSFAESSCAALVVAATSAELYANPCSLYFPLLISATGIFISFFTSFFATDLMTVDREEKIETTLKWQLIISTVLLTPALYFLAMNVLPETFSFTRGGEVIWVRNIDAFVCVACGLWSGLTIGVITEIFTSHSYSPVREVAESCRTGAATNIIFGLALGYLSTIIPTACLALTIYFSFYLASMYGIALAALGMLSNLAIALAIDGYGPISDNAGGMVEMMHLRKQIRQRTDALDAAGNTTAAIGKGFAIGSAALVSLALFGAFITRSNMTTVNILAPLQFAGLLVGAMLPYVFSALTMKSVGKAANQMVLEVRRQFALMKQNPSFKPEYARCVQISTQAALVEMILPGMIVMLSPIVTGWLFGPRAVAGLLAGILVSGVQLAISMANSGGAWDNAKKYIEKECLVPKSSKDFKAIKAAAVTGDTVGDPMKDTSGPSLNILVKLSAIISLVFGGFFTSNLGGILVS